MDDQMTEDILKRSKARCEELERMVNSPNVVEDHFESFDSSVEYGIQTFKAKSSLLDTETQKENCTPIKEHCENSSNVPLPDIYSTPPILETAGKNILIKQGASVKALRNRWEEIAKSEIAKAENSPLASSNKFLTNKFVSPATTIDQAFAFIGQNQEYSVSPPTTKFMEISKLQALLPKIISVSNLNDQQSLAKPSPKRNVAPEPPEPLTHLSLNYRPITPNSEVLGSLLDDINTDLEKYRNFNNSAAAVNESSDAAELHHTISFYRRQGRNNRRSDLPVTELGFLKPSASEASTSNSLNSSNTSSEIPSNDATLKRLHEQMIVQQDQICQASRALSYCRQTDHFRGSREEVDAQRALLIATERRRAYCLERDRVISTRQGITECDASEPRGTLSFSYIAVRLSRDFINMYIQQHSASRNYHFIVLIKCGEHVLHTSLTDSNQSIKNGFVEFTHFIQLAGLVADFVCTIEVYGLRANQTGTLHDKSKRKTIKKIVGGSFGSSAGETNILAGLKGGLIGIMDSGFQKLGYVTLNRSCLGRERFLMSEVLYPLDGNIVLKMRCFAEETESLDYRGFLSLYQIVSGLGSWTRFWCVLGSGQMLFWRYPEDEGRKVSSVTLDLSKCLTNVSEVPGSVSSFPNSMQVDVAIATGHNPVEEIRMLFAADTADEMDAWIDAINKTIRHTNIWNYPVDSTAITSCSSSSTSSGVSSAATKTRC